MAAYLATGHTTTTGVLAVLSYTTMTGRNVSAANEIVSIRTRCRIVVDSKRGSLDAEESE